MVPDNYSTKPWGWNYLIYYISLLVISGMCGTER